MDTTKTWGIGILMLTVAVVVSGCESADHKTAARDEPSWYWGVPPEKTYMPQASLRGTQVGANLHRATKLVGLPVRNLDGKQLGSIYDLVLTPDLDGVSYVAVSDARGFHAIPWSAVRTEPEEGNIVFAISEQDLRQDPGFTTWPAEGNPRWLDHIRGQAEGIGPAPATAESVLNRRFSLIEGMPVRGQDGRKIGTVRDLVVATDTGAVAYAIVSSGGFLGLGREYAAVPRNAVDVDTQQWVARVDANRQTLHAHAFSPGRFPDLSDPRYARELSQAYGLEYGTVLGYVPAEE